MSDCLEREYRAELSDEEFWPYVLQGIRPGEDISEDLEDDILDVKAQYEAQACGLCGQVGGCGYDSEGRELIHAGGWGDSE